MQLQASPVPIRRVLGVRLPRRDPGTLWDITIDGGIVASTEPHDQGSTGTDPGSEVLGAHGRLCAPSLCHAHIHLDKCFLLQDPKYSDLEIVKGDFAEAMSLTTEAKRRFEEDDLLRRGRTLIEESIIAGVTHMRAFVELDADVGTKCLDAGLALKQEFSARCDVQICAFAQLPCFSGADGGEAVRSFLRAAVVRDGVDVVGSTPYVEADLNKMRENARWVSALALEHGKHLDFHMDYNLDTSSEPFIFDALSILRSLRWVERGGKCITMGHCTRLTCFEGNEQWAALRDAIGSLPVSFVGLPTSDLFMMRTPRGVRGTLHVPQMIQKHTLDAAIGINNIGNAFTPHGNCDPLALASLCVGVYQVGTKTDAELLYECVSGRAKSSVGFHPSSLDIKPGDKADLVIFGKAEPAWRTRRSISEVVYDAGGGRMTIMNGCLVSVRK